MSLGVGARRVVVVLVATAALAYAGLLTATTSSATTAADRPLGPGVHQVDQGLPEAAHQSRRPTPDATPGHQVPLSEATGPVGPDHVAGPCRDDLADHPVSSATPPRRSDRAPPTAP